MTHTTSILNNIITPGGCSDTLSGATYIRDNSEMARVRAFLGKAFDKTLDAAKVVAPTLIANQ